MFATLVCEAAPVCICAGAAETAEAGSVVATAAKPAKLVTSSGPTLLSNASALRITLRPKSADPDVPFLAQVFVKQLSDANDQSPGELLGVVSFFPLRVGQAQQFVLPAPERGFPPIAPQKLQLRVKLISANPDQSLHKASVEVLGAQFAD